MSHFPPTNVREWIKTLERLGFTERRVGKGKHVNKFTHPTKHTLDNRIQRDFIIVPHKIFPVLSTHIVKGHMLFGFSVEEIEAVAKGQK